FFGRMSVGHVHLLSILSWGILVYQTNMSFLLHFILQRGKEKEMEKFGENLQNSLSNLEETYQ
ncbi:hypothetical protein, partial [Streptococcus hyovaginalis]|uniref:hypothetical protein n=1 Tax=Streptococcus hyovaginalis TaxID=149015 RepID=UPI0039EC0F08